MSLAPIILFTYNRLSHTRRTVEALQKNKLAPSSDLIIYSDAAKTTGAIPEVKAVRDFLHSVGEFKSVSIVEREKNYGLGKNIIEGVKEVIGKFDKVIVMED